MLKRLILANKSRRAGKRALRYLHSLFRILYSLFPVPCSLLFLCLAAIPASATWVQHNNKTGSGTTDPISTAAFASALNNPSIIIVTIRISDNTNTSTPYDTAGHTYIDSGTGQIKYASNARTIQVFYALNTSTTASNVVSLANPSALAIQIIAEEWTGGATSSPVDGTPASNPNANTGAGGGQNTTVGPTTPTACTDLIIGASGNVSATTVTVGTGFTANTQAGSYRANMEYVVQTTPAAISATWNDSVDSDNYGAIVAAFKAAHQSCAATPSETNIASDAIASLAGFARADSESNTASDAIARSQGITRQANEANATSDAIARAAAFERAASEANTALDALARMAAYGRSSDETNIASDLVDRSTSAPGSYSAMLYESNVASDAVARMVVYARSASEVNAASDAISQLRGILRAVNESNPSVDGLTRLASFTRIDAEALSVTDNLGRTRGVPRAITETFTTSDALDRALALFRGEAETLTFSDLVSGLWTHSLIRERHKFILPGRVKAGTVPGRVKSGEGPVH